jgi:hypothetical protein
MEGVVVHIICYHEKRDIFQPAYFTRIICPECIVANMALNLLQVSLNICDDDDFLHTNFIFRLLL